MDLTIIKQLPRIADDKKRGEIATIDNESQETAATVTGVLNYLR